MKQIFLVLMSVMSVVSCNGQDVESVYNKFNKEKEENDLYWEGLKGNVKEVLEINYEANEKFGEIIKGKIIDNPQRKMFDKKGEFTELITYDTEGNLESRIIPYDDTEANIYDSKGVFIGKTMFQEYYNDKNTIIEIDTYLYKDGLIALKNNLLKEYRYYDISEIIKDINKYIKEEKFHLSKIFTKYNEEGKEIESIEYDNLWGTYDKSNFEYDKDGSLLGDKEESYKKYEYDSQKNWIRRVKYDNKGKAIELHERIIKYYN